MIKLFYAISSVSLFFSLTFSGFATEFRLSWPTPNPSFAKGLGYSTFLQKTGPDKDFSSGAFGCVRNNGYKFHEGIDLFPVKRSHNGKAEDQVFSAIEGKIAYVNNNPSHSAYGRYIVIEHPSLNPCLYSLYAHLASISPNVKVGVNIKEAIPLGKMGNSSSFKIPLSRSHLHFEIGLRLSNNFQSWFDKKDFNTPNRHGNYSGFNLVGFDPLHFFSEYQKKTFSQPIDYLNSFPVILKIRVHAKNPFDFANRYPELCPNYKNEAKFWDCSFGPFGIPLRIEPASQVNEDFPAFQILSYDLMGSSKPCRALVKKSGFTYKPADQLLSNLEILFGL